jgi:hypothetical protein
MRSIFLSCVFAFLAGACTTGGDDTGGAIDAARIDAGGLPVCTGLLYDRCSDTVGGTDCMSGICRTFNMLGANGCTQACGAGCPPDPTGAPVRCNGDGSACRPDNLNNACMAP